MFIFDKILNVRRYTTRNHYRKAWDEAVNIDPPIPLNVDIELSTVCNLRCPFCFLQDTTYKNSKKKFFMDYELACNIIDDAVSINVPALKFNWRGESTLHQHFVDILKYAKHKRSFYDIIVNTNGNCPESSLPGLMYATKVIVSLDTIGRENYKQHRPRGNLQNVFNTIEYLLARGHEGVVVRRVITKDNKRENFKDAILKLFGNLISISEHYCFDRNKSSAHQIVNTEHNVQKNPQGRVYCCYPSQRIVIATDGKMFPCCVDYNQTMLLGIYPKDSLSTAWNSMKIIQLRNMLRENMIPPTQCQDCTSFMAYNCKERENLQK